LNETFNQKESWKKIFVDLGDESLIEYLKQDIQLFLLQNTDDDHMNCLHHTLKNGNEELTLAIIRKANELSDVYSEREDHELLARF